MAISGQLAIVAVPAFGVKIYPENAQPVEFGERLFAIRAS